VHLDLWILINIGLGILSSVCGFAYHRRVGGWMSLYGALLAAWIAVLYIIRAFFVPSLVTHGVWGEWLLRPTFTAMLVLLTAKAVAGYKRTL
jgi:hypothetical protein